MLWLTVLVLVPGKQCLIYYTCIYMLLLTIIIVYDFSSNICLRMSHSELYQDIAEKSRQLFYSMRLQKGEYEASINKILLPDKHTLWKWCHQIKNLVIPKVSWLSIHCTQASNVHSGHYLWHELKTNSYMACFSMLDNVQIALIFYPCTYIDVSFCTHCMKTLLSNFPKNLNFPGIFSK